MAITITVDDVRAFFPSIQATDSYIHTMINVVSAKLDSCLDAAYPLPDGEPIQEAIKLNLVCHFAELQGNGRLKSRKAANGSSASYESFTDRDGLALTGYGETVLMIDSAGCWMSMIPQTWFVDTFGGDNESLYWG